MDRLFTLLHISLAEVRSAEIFSLIRRNRIILKILGDVVSGWTEDQF